MKFPHGIKGIVLFRNTVIGDNVTIFHQVTCGGPVEITPPHSDELHSGTSKKSRNNIGFVLKNGCILCAGAKIISNRETIVVGEGTIIGANAVLTKSTGDYEVWAGVPARCIKKYNKYDT